MYLNMYMMLHTLVLPYMWFNKLGCVEPFALVSSVHVPGNSILFESIPVEEINQRDYRPSKKSLKLALLRMNLFSCSLPQLWTGAYVVLFYCEH